MTKKYLIVKAGSLKQTILNVMEANLSYWLIKKPSKEVAEEALRRIYQWLPHPWWSVSSTKDKVSKPELIIVGNYPEKVFAITVSRQIDNKVEVLGYAQKELLLEGINEVGTMNAAYGYSGPRGNREYSATDSLRKAVLFEKIEHAEAAIDALRSNNSLLFEVTQVNLNLSTEEFSAEENGNVFRPSEDLGERLFVIYGFRADVSRAIFVKVQGDGHTLVDDIGEASTFTESKSEEFLLKLKEQSSDSTFYYARPLSEPGRAVFEAYSAARHHLSYDGKRIPRWECLPCGNSTRSAWNAAAMVAQAMERNRVKE